MNREKINSKIKLSNNSCFVILIFVILKFRNIGRSTLRRFKFWPPPFLQCENAVWKNLSSGPGLFYDTSRAETLERWNTYFLRLVGCIMMDRFAFRSPPAHVRSFDVSDERINRENVRGWTTELKFHEF